MTDFRKMRRFKQQANDEECLRLLGTAKRGVLAVLGDNEYPYTVPFKAPILSFRKSAIVLKSG